MTTSSLAAPPDYATTIRAEIEREVLDLKRRATSYVPESGGWEPTSRFVPDWIQLGYCVNTHRGQSLYQPGDEIAGLPVRITEGNPRTISVGTDDEIEFGRAVGNGDPEDDGGPDLQYIEQQVKVSTQW